MSPMSGNRSDREHNKFKETPSGKTAVRVCVDDDTPIPTEDTGDLNGFFLEDTDDSDTSEFTHITYAVPASKELKINNVICSTSVEGVCKVKKDGSLIGIIRVGAGNKNGLFPFNPSRTLIATEVLTVTFTATSATGIDVDIFVQSRLLDV